MLGRKRPTLLRSSQPTHYALEHKKPGGSTVDRGLLSHANCIAYIDPNLRLNTNVVYGRGASGTVYQLCNRLARCDKWVAKIVLLHAAPQSRFEQTPEDFVREAETASLLGDIGIGARVLGFRVCQDAQVHRSIGVLVTELMDETLDSYAKKYPRQFAAAESYIHAQVLQIVEILAREGFRHVDLHTSNCMVKVSSSGDIQRIALVDAGGIVRCKVQPCDRAKVIDRAMDMYYYSVKRHIYHLTEAQADAAPDPPQQAHAQAQARPRSKSKSKSKSTSKRSASASFAATQRASAASQKSVSKPKPKRSKHSKRSPSIGSK